MVFINFSLCYYYIVLPNPPKRLIIACLWLLPMQFRTLREAEFKGKRVLLRSNLNVPIEGGLVADDTRIRESLPTIRYILEQGCSKLLIMAHLGRPKAPDPKFSLLPVSLKLSELLGESVFMMHDCINIAIPDNKRIVLLENVRFHPEEEANDDVFAAKLAANGDIYVNDAFGDSHRAHASIAAITKHLPSYAGFLMEKELKMLGGALESPKRPFIAILGGAKVSDKIKVIENLLPKVDALLLGGAMIFTFFKAQGKEIGKSLFEPEQIDLAARLLHNPKVMLPVDIVAAREAKENSASKVMRSDSIEAGWIGLDIGPASIELYKEKLAQAKTVLWNGPMGMFEIKEFAKGTEQLALFLAELDATVIIGGGDSASAVSRLGIAERITHISTGGGASLEFLEGRVLPGIQALKDCPFVK